MYSKETAGRSSSPRAAPSPMIQSCASLKSRRSRGRLARTYSWKHETPSSRTAASNWRSGSPLRAWRRSLPKNWDARMISGWKGRWLRVSVSLSSKEGGIRLLKSGLRPVGTVDRRQEGVPARALALPADLRGAFLSPCRATPDLSNRFADTILDMVIFGTQVSRRLDRPRGSCCAGVCLSTNSLYCDGKRNDRPGNARRGSARQILGVCGRRLFPIPKGR
jgi:hypothetical protein